MRHIPIDAITDAAHHVYTAAVRTPLIKLDLPTAAGGPEVYLKLAGIDELVDHVTADVSGAAGNQDQGVGHAILENVSGVTVVAVKQRRQRSAGTMHCAHHVDLQQCLPLVIVGLGYRIKVAHGGIVDQHIQLASWMC